MKGRYVIGERVSGIGLQDALWLGLPLILAAFPLAPVLGMPVVVFYIACALLHLGCVYFGKTLPMVAIWAVLLVGVAGVVAIHESMVGLQAGTAVFLVLCGTKLLETRTRREYEVLCCLGYFLILGDLLDTQDLLLCIYATVLFCLVTVALLRFHSTLPSRIGQTRQERPPLFFPLWRTLAETMLQALPIILILFVFFPRAPLGFGLQLFRRTLTGMSDSLEPGSVEKLVQNGSLAFRVHFLQGDPGRAPFYWRGVVLWKCEGMTWEKGRDGREQTTGAKSATRPIRQEVVLEPHGKRWLFSLDAPASFPKGARLQLGRYLLSNHPVDYQQLYQVTSGDEPDRIPAENDGLRLGGGGDAIPARILALAQSWKGTPKEKVLAAERFFSQGFTYALDCGRYQGSGWRMLDHFLFERKVGFCSHYAAAFASLMRIAGVPARVVMGYHGGELNPLGGFYSVYQSDAHAWCEVWLDGIGWKRIDPTAVVTGVALDDLSRATQAGATSGPASQDEWARSGLFRQVRYQWEALSYQWAVWVLGYDHDVQEDLLRRTGLRRFGILAVFSWSWIVILLFLAGLWFFLRWRSRRTEDPLARSYETLCRKLARRGLTRDPAEPAAAYFERVIGQRPDWQPALEPLFGAYILLRYAHWKLEDSAAVLHRFRQGVRELVLR